MKVTAKPLKGDTFEVEIDGEDKVEELKKRIAAARPEFPADSSKLIYAGRILVDDQQIKEYSIKDGEFVVVMVAKAKAATPAPAAAAPATTPAPAAGEPAAAPTPAPAAAEQAASNLVSGSAMEGTITQLMEMGFERPQVERALRAAFNNPDRAVEYLFNGIPAGMGEEGGAAPPAGGAAPPAAGGGTPAATPAATGGAAGGPTPFPAMPTGGAFPAMPTGGGGGSPTAGGGEDNPAFAALRNHPRFAELAQMCAQNPAMLQQILPAIAQQNPELVQAINQDPEGFMRMLQQAGAGGGGGVQHTDPVSAMLAAAQGGGGGGGGQNVIRLSEEDRAAVERLSQLCGCDPQAAAQAYIACDKNEELAANFLFDNADSMND